MMPKTETLNLSSMKLENFLKFLQNPSRREQIRSKFRIERKTKQIWPISTISPSFLVASCGVPVVLQSVA